MFASVIIPTKDKLSRLRLTLQALAPQMTGDIEVIVILDGCDRDTIKNFKELKLGFKPVLIECPTNIGRAAARNKGIRSAAGEIIIFLDDDRIPEPDFIKKHLAYHQKERCVLIGGRYNLNYSEEEIEAFYVHQKVIHDFNSFTIPAVPESFSVFRIFSRLFAWRVVNSISFMTGNASVKRNDLIEAGLFDENFVGWGLEDVDLGYRLAMNNLKFIRDYSILNYHLDHPFTRTNQMIEYQTSLKYFFNKIKNDRLAILICRFYFYATGLMKKMKNIFLVIPVNPKSN